VACSTSASSLARADADLAVAHIDGRIALPRHPVQLVRVRIARRALLDRLTFGRSARGVGALLTEFARDVRHRSSLAAAFPGRKRHRGDGQIEGLVQTIRHTVMPTAAVTETTRRESLEIDSVVLLAPCHQ
jgi:hypothetical protein